MLGLFPDVLTLGPWLGLQPEVHISPFHAKSRICTTQGAQGLWCKMAGVLPETAMAKHSVSYKQLGWGNVLC